MCKRKKSKKSISNEYNKSQDIILIDKKVNITNHFCKRWNERVFNDSFNSKEIYRHLESKVSKCEVLKAISGDFYLLNDYLVIAAKDENKVTLITTFGSTSKCSLVYDYIKNHGAFSFNQTLKKYGKLPLCTYN